MDTTVSNTQNPLGAKLKDGSYFLISLDGDDGDGDFNRLKSYDVSKYPYNINFGHFHASEIIENGYMDADISEWNYTSYEGTVKIIEVSPVFKMKFALSGLKNNNGKYVKEPGSRKGIQTIA